MSHLVFVGENDGHIKSTGCFGRNYVGNFFKILNAFNIFGENGVAQSVEETNIVGGDFDSVFSVAFFLPKTLAFPKVLWSGCKQTTCCCPALF